MVFCRGCAKQIHESAPICPHCGAPQGLPSSRNIVTLIFVGIGWTLVFWLTFLFLGGFLIGVAHPENAEQLAEEFGQTMSLPMLLISACVSGVLTKLGLLPATKK